MTVLIMLGVGGWQELVREKREKKKTEKKDKIPSVPGHAMPYQK